VAVPSFSIAILVVSEEEAISPFLQGFHKIVFK